MEKSQSINPLQLQSPKIEMKSIFIIGPSGSGKSTLAQHLRQIYKSLFGSNSVLLVNLDPANPHLQQQHYDIDVNALITLEDIMEEFQIGPNGAMIYAMEFLEENKQWLHQKIQQKALKKQPYLKTKYAQPQKVTCQRQSLQPLTIIFDLPGQIQLYLNNQATKNLIQQIKCKHTLNTCLLQLFDSTYIYQVRDFVSLTMMSLVSMFNFQMPHINLLNKIDVIKGQRPGLGMLNDYLDIFSMNGIIEDLTFMEEDEEKNNYKILHALSNVLDQYNQVGFVPCSVFKEDLLKYLVVQIEKIFGMHQIYKANNTEYALYIQGIDKDMAKEKIITELENQLFAEEEQEQKQLEKVVQQIKKDKSANTSLK